MAIVALPHVTPQWGMPKDMPMKDEKMTKSNRKLIGALLIPVILVAYCIVAVALHLTIFIYLPMWAQLIYFAIAGVSWFFPAGALIKWMAKPQA